MGKICGCLCVLLCAGCVQAANLASEISADTQLRAMADELARSKALQLNQLEKPYFVQYASQDSDELSIAGALGGLTSVTHMHVRRPLVEVRVGDYAFDNTNSIYSGSARLGLFPIDDDYQAMRVDLWLSTDALYKAAIEQITRKRTALRDIADPDKTPDFAPAKPVQMILPVPGLITDDEKWEQTVRAVSGRFTLHPDITSSNVSLLILRSAYRLVNTEGTVARIPEDFTQFAIRASAVAADGSRVRNYLAFTELEADQLPAQQQLITAAEEVAKETERLAKAPVGEEYSGPVLFEQQAAAQLMAQVLADAVRLERKPVAPLGSNNPGLHIMESVWASRLGSKVTPDWMTIIDDPTQQSFQGVPLAGFYKLDDEGVLAQRVTLVERGTLKSFLLSREPVRNFNASNGHGRLPGSYGAEQAVIGNLFVQADHAVPESQLKQMLLEKVKAAGLKYGVRITRLDFPSTASVEELQSIARQLQRQGLTRTLTPPLVAYRVYPDGHEELVRGLRFKEFSAKDLRDVEAASDHPYVLNYMNNGSSFNMAGFGSDFAPSSVICPSLLFDNVDLQPAEDQLSKPPIVPPPSLITQP